MLLFEFIKVRASINYSIIISSTTFISLINELWVCVFRPVVFVSDFIACSQATDYTVSDLIDFYGYNRF